MVLQKNQSVNQLHILRGDYSKIGSIITTTNNEHVNNK